MGKYIFNYYSFVNESVGESKSSAEEIIALADQYIETDAYKAADYSTADKLSTLVDILHSQIKAGSGDQDAAEFMTNAMEISQRFVTEDSCLTCEEMMEPCDACKAHAEEMNNLSEQTPPQQPTQNAQYMAAGTKFCFFGSCRVDIKVIDTTTSQIITSKGAEGADAAQLYSQVLKMVQDDLTSKKITGVTLPTFEQLQDTSPKK